MSKKSMFYITVFFGWLGLHKFLQKKPIAGLVYLFTLGLFSFGWLFDSIAAYKDMKNNVATYFRVPQDPMPQSFCGQASSVYSFISDSCIDSLMSSHTAYRNSIGPIERDFTRYLLRALVDACITMPLTYDIKGACVNYKLSGYQLGRISLIDEHKQIQIITPNNVNWVDVQGLNDALLYVPQWIEYAKYLQDNSI